MNTEAMPVATLQEKSLSLYRFSVEQYHRMLETGVLTEKDRTELLEGWVVTKGPGPHSPPHDGSTSCIHYRLAGILSEEWIIRVKCSITTSDSEPEPDLAVARGPGLRYLRFHPRPRDIALIVEVADTTLAADRDIKGRLYARARIPVYWVVNLIDSIVEVYSNPRAGKSPAYLRRQDYTKRDTVPLVVGGQDVGMLSVSEVLP